MTTFVQRALAAALVICGAAFGASSAVACGIVFPCPAELSSYAHVQGLGFRNAGLLQPGTVYLWNTKTNAISQPIADVTLPAPTSLGSPVTLSGSNVHGISVDASFGTTVALNIGKKIVFTAENATRVHYRQIYTAMANEYAGDGPDKEEQWHIAELKKSSALRFLVVSDVVETTKATISTGGPSGDNTVSLVVTVPANGPSLKFALTNAQSLSCDGSGKPVPCFFEVLVAKPFINAAGNLDFTSDINYSQDALIQAMSNAF